MTITFEDMIKFVGFLLSVSAVITLIWRGFKKIDEMQSNRREIEEIRKEQKVLCKGVLACLDGLKQLGANGNVTETYNALNEHIINEAHN